MKAFEIGIKKTVVFQKAALQHMVKSSSVDLVSLELPGHGEDSFTEHCMVPAYEQLVAMICEEVGRRAGDAEQVILMGYSFGATLMTVAASELESDGDFKPRVVGLIGISSAFDVSHNVARWQLVLANLIAPLSRFLFRHIPKWSGYVTIGEMDVGLISPDPALQKSINEDDLVYKGRIPLNTSAQVYKTSVAAKSIIGQVSCPVLLLHSRDDAIALPPDPQTLAPHIKLRLFKNLRHNCIDGLAREAVVARRAITQFIVEKL